ncbi:hypothetical protein C8R47DRAFT_1254424 [Mycena vitilis]|nr:hypothetical protein C8R47DRAFT_1254424 [Mycena vitilis]
MLATVPIIPDVTIHFRSSVKKETDIPRILATLSRNGTDPVVIVGCDTVRVSCHRRTPAAEDFFAESTILSFDLPPISSLTARGVLRDMLCRLVLSSLGALLLILLGCVIVYRSIYWVYRYTLRPWDPATRIATDLRPVLGYGDAIRIQIITVPGGAQFTLAISPFQNPLTLPHLPSLSSAQYVAMLVSLDLQEELSTLIVHSGCKLQFSALMDFIRRHPSLSTLILFPTQSTKPAYIPHILPADRGVAEMSASYCYDDLAFEVSHALDNVRYTGHRGLSLHLCARRCKSFPWVHNTKRATKAAANVTPAITHVELVLRFRRPAAVHMAGLPRWLERHFPNLTRVEIHGLVASDAEQFALAKAVLDARIRANLSTVQWEGVQFHP